MPAPSGEQKKQVLAAVVEEDKDASGSDVNRHYTRDITPLHHYYSGPEEKKYRCSRHLIFDRETNSLSAANDAIPLSLEKNKIPSHTVAFLSHWSSLQSQKGVT
ncbi:hypothetical protein TNCT_364471 [Trichonephila clavata]|uniref:Uncharacterized protein n=1 Tax=Trichonephila clavata TaxID=2740835 RepID=A0A8X6L336_TRICU|nr:hypothetical protein TNCT_364471 [Trichonephila clavata]